MRNSIKAFFTIDNLDETVRYIEQMLVEEEGLTLHKSGYPTVREGQTRARIGDDLVLVGFVDVHILHDTGRPVAIEVFSWRKNRVVVRPATHGGFSSIKLRRAIQKVVAGAHKQHAQEQKEMAEFVAERVERARKDAVIRNAGLGTTSERLEGPGVKAEWTPGYGITLTGDVERLVEVAKMLGLAVVLE